MPTPRRSGAPLGQISFVTPGALGLNKQTETTILGPEWATAATNAIFDSASRLAARQGWLNQTTTPMTGTPVVEQLHELVREDGTTQVLSAAGLKIWRDVSVPTDITGTATVTVGNNWQFVNYNGLCLGFQHGEQPIVYNGSTTFADVVAASGTAPTGNCAVVHSGRVWASDTDKQTIKYSALLDHTHWATGAGFIDMTSVWPQGTDEIVALSFFNNRMVVFGKNKIVFFSDGEGFPLGLNPSTIQVSDTIVGVGCIARDSVQQIEGGDVLFLSAQGVQSLGRLIQERSNPINNVTANVRDYLTNLTLTETPGLVRSVYSPENSFYLLSLPSSGVSFCIDTTSRLQDGSMRVTEWSNMVPRALLRTIGGILYITLKTGAGGKIGRYTGYTDNGSPYSFDFSSAWLDLGQDAAQYLKILKNISATFWISAGASVAVKWDFDFEGSFSSRTATLLAPGTAEWGIMEWGLFEWGGGVALRHVSIPCSGTGQHIRVGAQTAINGSSFAIQQLNLFTKIGRIAK
jgi:hypothetical protein